MLCALKYNPNVPPCMSATPFVQTNLNRWVGIGIVEAGQNTRMENADMHIGQVLDGKQVSRFWLAQSYFNTMSSLRLRL